MRTKRPLLGLLLLLVCLVAQRSAPAADDVLKLIPEKATAYVVIKNLQEFSADIDRIATRLQVPPPSLLLLAKVQMSVNAGVPDTGELAFAMVGADTSAGGAPSFAQGSPLVLLRTDDYDALLKGWNATPADGALSNAVIGRANVVVAHKSNYAVISPKSDVVKQVVSADSGIDVNAAQQSFTAAADMYAVVTTSGVKQLTRDAINGLQMIKQQVAGAGPQADAIAAGLGVYETLFQSASENLQQMTTTLTITEDGTASLGNRLTWNEPGKAIPKSSVTPQSQLAGLPNWSYLFAMGSEIGDMDEWVKMSTEMTKSMYGQNLTEKQVEALMESSRASMKNVHGMSFIFGVPDAGASMFDRFGMLMETEDPQAFVKNYLASMQQMKEIFAEDEKIPFKVVSAEARQVAGVDGMELEMQITPAVLGPGGEQVKEMFDQLYGKDGRIKVYVGVAGSERVAIAYTSEARLKELIAAAKSSDGAFNADKGVQRTTDLLQDEAELVGFFSPAGTVEFVQRMAGMFAPPGALPEIPAFPTSPPLGFSVKSDTAGSNFRLVIPGETWSAIGTYIGIVQTGGAR